MWNLYFHIVLNLLDEEGKSYNTVCSFDFFWCTYILQDHFLTIALLPLIFIFVAFLPVFFIGIVDLGWCSPYTRLYRENELTGGRGARLLPSLLLLLETEAGPAAQFSLFLGKVISTGGASPGLQDVVYLKKIGKNWH